MGDLRAVAPLIKTLELLLKAVLLQIGIVNAELSLSFFFVNEHYKTIIYTFASYKIKLGRLFFKMAPLEPLSQLWGCAMTVTMHIRPFQQKTVYGF